MSTVHSASSEEGKMLGMAFSKSVIKWSLEIKV